MILPDTPIIQRGDMRPWTAAEPDGEAIGAAPIVWAADAAEAAAKFREVMGARRMEIIDVRRGERYGIESRPQFIRLRMNGEVMGLQLWQ